MPDTNPPITKSLGPGTEPYKTAIAANVKALEEGLAAIPCVQAWQNTSWVVGDPSVQRYPVLITDIPIGRDRPVWVGERAKLGKPFSDNPFWSQKLQQTTYAIQVYPDGYKPVMATHKHAYRFGRGAGVDRQGPDTIIYPRPVIGFEPFPSPKLSPGRVAARFLRWLAGMEKPAPELSALETILPTVAKLAESNGHVSNLSSLLPRAHFQQTLQPASQS